jgi:hypothetical protein
MLASSEKPGLDSEENITEKFPEINLERSTIDAFVPGYETFKERTLEKGEEENLVQKVNKVASALEKKLNLNLGDEIDWTIRIQPKMSEKQEEDAIDSLMETYTIEFLRSVGTEFEGYELEDIVKILSHEEIEEAKEKFDEIYKNIERGPKREPAIKEVSIQIAKKILKKTKVDFQRASANVGVTIKDNNGKIRAAQDNITFFTNEDDVSLKYVGKVSPDDCVAFLIKILNDKLEKNN